MSVSKPRRPWICFFRVQKPLKWISFRECVCVFFRVCLCADVVVLALSRRPVPPSSGKTLFALADAPWMQVLKSSLPPQFSGETGTTSFRKKKKKSSWSFKRHGITLSAKSCPVRRWDFRGESLVSVSCCVLYVLFADFLGLNVSVCILGRLPRLGPFVNNLCGIVQCYLGRTQRAKHSKECVQSF